MIGTKQFTCKNLNGTKVLHFVDTFNGLNGTMTYNCYDDHNYSGLMNYKMEYPIVTLQHIKAYPRRMGLGALYVYLLSLRANIAGYPTIEVSSANPEERVFYEQTGFYAKQNELQMHQEAYNFPLPSSIVQLFNRGIIIGSLEGRTLEVLTKSMASVLARWKIVDNPVGKLI